MLRQRREKICRESKLSLVFKNTFRGNIIKYTYLGAKRNTQVIEMSGNYAEEVNGDEIALFPLKMMSIYWTIVSAQGVWHLIFCLISTITQSKYHILDNKTITYRACHFFQDYTPCNNMARMELSPHNHARVISFGQYIRSTNQVLSTECKWNLPPIFILRSTWTLQIKILDLE